VLARLHDPIWALVSLGLIALLLRFIRSFQTARQFPSFPFRKVLHAVVGALTIGLTVPFHHRGWAMVPPAVFTVVNAVPRWRPRIPGLAAYEGEARGLWLFPLGVCVVDLLFWDFGHRGAVFAAIAALALGDPAAALVGSRWGQRKYTGWARGRSVEGSIAFFLFAGIATGIVATVCPGGPPALRAGVGCAAIGALVEALSPAGVDNLTIPVAVALAYQFLA